MHGFYGRYLNIDLGKKNHSIETINDDVFKTYLGGKGLASYLLYELNPPGVDPLSAENTLIFATGPFRGQYHLGLLPLRGVHQITADRVFC